MVSKYKRLQDQLIIYISNFQRLSAMLLERGETDRQTDIDLASGHSDYCTTPLTQTHTQIHLTYKEIKPLGVNEEATVLFPFLFFSFEAPILKLAGWGLHPFCN